ncbi:MAG: NUDIX domain-containing protein [Burkholderiales bacterium]|nr:NUDIX domain-containing protein [Burkholderiales bacterium]
MAAPTVSCGVLLVNRRDEIFVCHTTGTPRWDLPKGLADAGEDPRDAAVREAWEEAGLRLPGDALQDLGEFAYLPAKRLHLFALRVASGGVDVDRCTCRSFFPHHHTGRPTPEADAWAWKPLDDLASWCGKNMTRVLQSLDRGLLATLPQVDRVEVDVSPLNPSRTAC